MILPLFSSYPTRQQILIQHTKYHLEMCDIPLARLQCEIQNMFHLSFRRNVIEEDFGSEVLVNRYMFVRMLACSGTSGAKR